MQNRSTILTGSGLILAVATGAAAPDGQRLAYGPEAGTTVTRSIENTMAFELDDLSMIVGGQDFGAMMGGMMMNLEFVNGAVLDDKLVAMGDGRPAHLERTITEASQDMTMDIEVMGEGDSQDMGYSAGLEGRTLVFKWNAEAGEYDVSFKEDQEGDRVPTWSFEDLDLRSFLPTEEVDVDDSWEPTLDSLFGTFALGGDLRWLPDFDEDMAEEMADMQAQVEQLTQDMMQDAMQSFGEAIDGDVEAIFKGTREEDGVNVGVIAISIDVQMSYDFADLLSEMVAAMGEIEDMPDDFFMEADIATMDAAMEAEGVLLWNIGAGLPHSFDLEGDADFSVDFAGLVGAMEEEIDMEMGMSMSGSFEHAVSVEL
jgi:hypothetical protein